MWVGGGDTRLSDVESSTAGRKVELSVIQDVARMDDETSPDVRGIGVAGDSVVFEFGGRLYRAGTDRKVELINSTSPSLMDVAIDGDGNVVGAPWFPGGEALVRLRDGEWVKVGPTATPPKPGEGRLSVAPDGSAVRTVRDRGLLRIGSDDSVSVVPVDTQCPPLDVLGVAADTERTWVGYETCGGLASVSADGSATMVVPERTDPSYCRDRPEDRLSIYGLAVDADGRVWIADPHCGTLEYFDGNELRGLSHEVADVMTPIDLGFDGDGNLFVLDAGRRAILRIAAGDLPAA